MREHLLCGVVGQIKGVHEEEGPLVGADILYKAVQDEGVRGKVGGEIFKVGRVGEERARRMRD